MNKLKTILSIAILLISVKVEAQTGTPNQLRVKTDSTNALLVSGAPQVLPLSQPTLFSNIQLKTDASGNLVVTLTTTSSKITVQFPVVGASTTTPGLELINTSPATVGVTVQYSPSIRLVGAAWNSVGAASETDEWIIQNQPATNAGVTNSFLSFNKILAGGAQGNIATMNASNGAFVAAGSIVAGSGAGLLWTSRSRLNSPSDGIITLVNAAQTDFTRLQFGGTTASFPSLKRTNAILNVRLADDSGNASITALSMGIGTTSAPGTGFIQFTGGLRDGNSGNIIISETAPTISSGFGTSPSIVASNGTAAFEINVGTGGSATSGIIGLPTAATGWNCYATDITTASATVFLTKQTASSTTTATVGNFNTSGAAAAWVASDRLRVSCFAY